MLCLFLGTAIFVVSCSDSINPAQEKECSISLRVEVKDTLGNNVPGARIYLSEGIRSHPEYAGTTDNNGVYQTVLADVPFKGRTYTLRIAEPEDDKVNYCEPSGETFSLLLSCCDTTIVSRAIILCGPQCDNIRRDYKVILDRCLDDPNASKTALLTIPCFTGCGVLDFTFEAAKPPLPPSLQIQVIGDPRGDATSFPSTVSIPDKQFVVVQSSYLADEELYYSGTVSYTATCGGEPCFYGDINISLHARICEIANCPPTDTTYTFIREEPVCITTSIFDTLRIRYSNSFNEKADLIFDVRKDFTLKPDVTLRPFNTELGPKQVLEFLIVQFNPKRIGPYIDSVIIGMKTRNSFGIVKDCEQTIKIVVQFQGVGPSYTISSGNTIRRCIGANFAPLTYESDTTCSVTIYNPSSCVLSGPIRFSLGGPDARYFTLKTRSPLGEILPKSHRSIIVDVNIAASDIWDFDGLFRHSRRPTDFNAFLYINSDGPPRIADTVALFAQVDTSCFCPGGAYLEQSDTTQLHHGFWTTSNSRTFANGWHENTFIYDFYENGIFPAVTGGDGTAIIESSTGSFIEVTNLIRNSSECVCDLMNRNIFLTMNSFSGGEDRITVRGNEYYLWKHNTEKRFMLIEFWSPHFDKRPYIRFFPCQLLVWGN